MTIEEANHIIADDSALPVDWVLAAGTLTSSLESSYGDLLACLKRRGNVASIAATALYVRTKRPRKDDSVDSFSMDYEDWRNYLWTIGVRF